MRASGTAVCIAIAMLAGCSKAPDGTDAPAASDTAGAPGIAVTAAPGVAFNYRYGFRLPPRAIAAVQEAHASTCEKLGIARCRITGMDYRVVGENDIRGSLRFKLDPAIARAFGKRGIDIVQDAKGTLVSAEITGTDAAEAIERAGGTQAEAAAAVARADAALARSDASAEERAELQRQRAAAATAARDAAATAADNRASLARTPMTFDYESGDAVRGFDTSAPLTSALDTMVASGQVTLAVLLGIVAIFGPPAIVFVIGLLLWRRMRRPVARWRREADD
ncbi:MAG: hypothetical protein NDI74_06615 [Sphingomonas sp.]|jgi:hypothetical protein|nr:MULTISPECIES: hypothetical protein [Sphingomonas]ATI55149.1 hypothetical protein CP552_05395 [Sphingomonas melonis]MBX8843620.1 hypothetical protein [Sphingomonas melonis]MBX8852936.1 hypothetical protein [Sphingomonas melonis]MBX8898195.1 hypothetical protein [Sphingomonas melonis]MCM2299085.1 hypothetical protein [Sphingomonas sp.]